MPKRIKVTTYDEKLWKDFEEFVINTYGAKYSFYGRELEKAVKYHLATMGHKDYPDKVMFPGEQGKTPENDIEHTRKLRGHVKTLFEWVVKTHKEDDRLPFVVIKTFLLNECALTDNRTYKKYVKILVGLNVLEELEEFELYAVNGKEEFLSLYIEVKGTQTVNE